MPQTELLRLKQIKVQGLFNIYDHCINLNLTDRATLLHGPNGIGKTAVLRMANALLQDNLAFFRSVPFSQFVLSFHDGSKLELEVTAGSAKKESKYILRLRNDRTSHESKVDWDSRAELIASQIEHLRPHNRIRKTWIDLRDGEILSSSKVVSTYSDRKQSETKEVKWFTRFLKNANAHLIEAERLVQIDREARPRYEGPWTYRAPSMISTVNEYSKDFRKRLGEAMARYGRQSQRLDQSFPQRLISATEELSVVELQSRMNVLDEKTADLKSVGILDETPSHPFDISSFGDIDNTQARVMALYVSDTETKLQVLVNLAKRTRLLVDNVNKKYRHKQIRIDRESGFVAESEQGQLLPLDSLSSGEQQELVLHYDLLFRVPSNTIVLIDEPELSLHVAWQKRFLPDLLEIIGLANFDALIATHSPFIIGEREDMMIGLGDSV